nr:hypothetical protein VCHA53O474_230056 [Vibrio chagasii]
MFKAYRVDKTALSVSGQIYAKTRKILEEGVTCTPIIPASE